MLVPADTKVLDVEDDESRLEIRPDLEQGSTGTVLVRRGILPGRDEQTGRLVLDRLVVQDGEGAVDDRGLDAGLGELPDVLGGLVEKRVGFRLGDGGLGGLGYG